jgi:hypothetical protein
LIILEAKLLPSLSYKDFMTKLDMCYPALELFTRHQGIAAEGYQMAHQIIFAQLIWFSLLFSSDPLMGVKIDQF